jgi:hypothetical protein
MRERWNEYCFNQDGGRSKGVMEWKKLLKTFYLMSDESEGLERSSRIFFADFIKKLIVNNPFFCHPHRTFSSH